MAVDEFNERAIPFSRDAFLSSFVLAIIMVVFGIGMIWAADSVVYTPDGIPKRRTAGFLFVIFGGIGLSLYLKDKFRNGPALIINDKGIADYSRRRAIGLIEWGNIADISLYRLEKRKTIFNEYLNNGKIWLIITVMDRNIYLNKGNFIKRIARHLEALLAEERDKNHIFISADLLKGDAAELEKTVQRYFAHYGATKT